MILHIGAGSFHRAHQAWYLHRLNEARAAGDPKWSLTVGNIRSDMNAVLDALAPQKGVYTLKTVTPQGERAYETIRSITRVCRGPADLAGWSETGRPAMQDHRVHRTEGGYYLDEHHKLDTANPDSRLTSRAAVRLSTARWRHPRNPDEASAGPVTLQNCDNLRSNGDRFNAGMIEFSTARRAACKNG